MIKKILVLVVVCSAVVMGQDYAPLTRTDKRAFISAAEAIRTAITDGSYEGVLRFGNSILKRYESILLDPKSKNLRTTYMEIEAMVSEASRMLVLDSTYKVIWQIEEDIKKHIGNEKYLLAAQRYGDYFDILEDKNIIDSAAFGHSIVYKDCILKYFDGSIETLREILALRHVDRAVTDSLSRVVEESYSEVFVSLSSTNDIQELFDFQKKYPGLFEQEVNDLINNYRAKWRANICRKPNIEMVEQFFVVFPEKDRVVDSVYHRLLYNDFLKQRDIASATKYLSHFPQGKHVRDVRMYIELLQEQHRLTQMQNYNSRDYMGREGSD